MCESSPLVELRRKGMEWGIRVSACGDVQAVRDPVPCPSSLPAMHKRGPLLHGVSVELGCSPQRRLAVERWTGRACGPPVDVPWRSLATNWHTGDADATANASPLCQLVRNRARPGLRSATTRRDRGPGGS
jgi:hypothetical protein